MARSTLTQVAKWALIALVLYAIWRCVKTDSQNFRTGGGSANVETFADVGDKVKCDKAEAAPAIPAAKGATCSGDPKKPGSCISASGGRLLPVLDPCFNMREICKQSILLEDHLFQTEKRCEDCIKKHFLTIEGLAEEAITLDKTGEYKLSRLELPERVRALEKEFLAKKDPESIAQQLRQIRKPLMAEYFHKF